MSFRSRRWIWKSGGECSLERGHQGLKSRRGDGAERELMRTRAKLGEMTMRMELAAELLEKRGFGQELRKLLRRGSE